MVVFVKIHPHVEIPARNKIEIPAVRIEGGIEIIVEIVGHGIALSRFRVIDKDLAVPVILDETVGDPLRVRRPGIVAYFPIELVVFHLV